MAILMPDLTVQVYNADYRVLSRVPWQEAVPQPGGCMPVLQRSQGWPDTAGSGDDHDSRALRADGAGQVPLRAGLGARL